MIFADNKASIPFDHDVKRDARFIIYYMISALIFPNQGNQQKSWPL